MPVGADYSSPLVRVEGQTLRTHGVHGRVAWVAQLLERVQKGARSPSQDRDLIPQHEDPCILCGVTTRQQHQPAERPGMSK